MTRCALAAGRRAPEPCEARREATARQEVVKRPLDEPRQSLPVTAPLRLRAERLVVIAHDLMQRPLVGATRAVAEGRRHSAGVGARFVPDA